jgi:glutaredoxin
MYSTSWCGVCTTARSYMREHDISFVDHDIDEDTDAKARAHALNPRNSVPVIDVGGDVMIGFSPRGLEAKLDQAARKRVGL